MLQHLAWPLLLARSIADRLPDGMLSLASPERGQTIQDSAASAHGPQPWNLAGVA